MDHELRRNAIYLLVRLAARSKQLPDSLFLEGVVVPEERSLAGFGGNADVFLGTYKDQEVAIKVLRLDYNDSDGTDYYMVRLLFASHVAVPLDVLRHCAVFLSRVAGLASAQACTYPPSARNITLQFQRDAAIVHGGSLDAERGPANVHQITYIPR